MKLRRRDFLAGGAAALAVFTGRIDERHALARGILTDPLLDEVIGRALGAAKNAGAGYADVRIVRRRFERVGTREDHVEELSATESYGLGIRVLSGGAWGFAASSRVDPKEAERIAILATEIGRENSRVMATPVELAKVPAHVDIWRTPWAKDPFKIPMAHKTEILLAINAELMKVKGVKYSSSSIETMGEWKLFASTDGGYIEQDITRIWPEYSATAVDTATGDYQSRAHELPPKQAGWEYVEEAPLLADAKRIAEDAVTKLRASSPAPGKMDLVLAPSNLWLTIHESVGHPTELDRALGHEANYYGTSFATTDKLGKLKYGSPIVTLYADKTTPGGLASCAYDDEGVKTQRWNLVKDGLFVGYQTTRELAGAIGEKTSRGTSYAEDHRSFPFQRMPNVSLLHGPKPLSTNDLIAATDKGIFITGNGSWSIDQQRYNFQFGGQMFYLIEKGKISRPLKNVAYQSNSVEFWNSCDMLGGETSVVLSGSMHDGKGEPRQNNPVSHSCPPARFRAVNVLDTNTRKKA